MINMLKNTSYNNVSLILVSTDKATKGHFFSDSLKFRFACLPWTNLFILLKYYIYGTTLTYLTSLKI